eukprot:scaffold787_cov115-Isochrysis_galbana.AAC.1
MAGSGRVLERGECLVGLESLTNMLGALVTNFVVHKTVKKCERALECGENRVTLEALADVLGAFWADAVGIKTASAKQGAITAQAHSELGWWGSERAHEHGEYLVALETLADVLGALVANTVGVKTVRAKQGAITNCQPLLTTKRAHSELGWWGSENALECGECLVDLESLADVLGAFRADVVFPKTARAKQGAITAVSLC